MRAEARGLADRGARALPMTPDLRFRAGSITKTFVAALVLDLAVRKAAPGRPRRALAAGPRPARERDHREAASPAHVRARRLRRRPARPPCSRGGGGGPGACRHRGRAGTGGRARRAVRVREHELRRARPGRRACRPRASRHAAAAPTLRTAPSPAHPLRAGHRPGPERPRLSRAVARGWSRETRSRRYGGVVGRSRRRRRLVRAEDVQRFFAALLGGRLLGPRLLREMRNARPRRGAAATASGSRSFRPRAARRGATRGTSRAPSQSRGTRATRRVRSCSSSTPTRSRPKLQAAVRRLQYRGLLRGVAPACRQARRSSSGGGNSNPQPSR